MGRSEKSRFACARQASERFLRTRLSWRLSRESKKAKVMFTLSAFADEISPDPQQQIDVLKACGLRHIELRSINKTNVLDLTDLQVKELKSLLDKHGFRLSAIGSPHAKIKNTEPFEPHFKRFSPAAPI